MSSSSAPVRSASSSAGEIIAKWPDKHVTLLDFSDDVLSDRFRPDLRAELRKQLMDFGVLQARPRRRTSVSCPADRRQRVATFTVK